MALSAALPMSVHKSKSLMKPSRLPSTKNVVRMPAPRHWRRFSVSSTSTAMIFPISVQRRNTQAR